VGIRIIPPGRSGFSSPQGNTTCPKCGKNYTPHGKLSRGRVKFEQGTCSVVECERCHTVFVTIQRNIVNRSKALQCSCLEKAATVSRVSYFIESHQYPPGETMTISCPGHRFPIKLVIKR
jgi:hypothetical protein